ncbi:MAG: hypothetical protein AAFN77_02670 [Planctomycetota bacterium]
MRVTFAQDQNQSEKPQRKLFVPFEDLDVLLLDGQSQRVMLSNEEYQALLDKAKQETINRAPENSSLVSANYVGKIQDGIARIEGELKLELLNEGLLAIPLNLSDFAIRTATLDGDPASLMRDSKGQMFLIVDVDLKGKSSLTQSLQLEMMLPMTTTAARQTMKFRLPANGATKMTLTVPGNVEVKSGVSVVSRKYAEDSDSTQFDLLMLPKRMQVVMSLNNKQLKDEQVIVARSVSIHELSTFDQNLHTTCSVDVVNGAVEQFRFAIPSGAQVESVETRLLTQWSVEAGENDAPSTLVVDLREATRVDFVINVKTSRRIATKGTWSTEPLVPLDVAGQVTVVGVIAESKLAAANFKTDSVIPIDHEFLLAAIPPTFEDTSDGNTSEDFRIVGAYYSPQSDYSVSMDFSIPNPELLIQSNSRLMVTDQKLELEGGLAVSNLYDRRVGLTVNLPEGWRFIELTDAANRAVEFSPDAQQPNRIVVRLQQRLGPTPTRLFFKAETTPDNWLDSWQENQVAFTGIQVDGQTSHIGSVAIATREDLTISPIAREKLELLEEAGKVQYQASDLNALLAYEFAESDYTLQVSLKRIEPIVLAQAYNFFAVLPQAIRTRQEIVFNVKRADEDTFAFDLPLDTPTSINIRSATHQLKDSTSEDVDGVRRWTVQLSQPVKGNVHLLVDYEVAQTDPTGTIELLPLIARQVQLQNSFVVVEGSNELDTVVDNPDRAIDMGEVSMAQYQTSRQLLGAFAWADVSKPIQLTTVRRPFFPLPGAIVQHADLVSVISTDGKLQTAARFSMATKQLPFLEVELPANSTLWSVQLDGQPAKPQLQGARLLVSLVGGAKRELRDLQIVYETRIDTIGLTGTMEADAPILRVNRSATNVDDWEEVPLVDSSWRLVVPKGYSITDASGPMPRRPTVIESLREWMLALGGDFAIRAAVSNGQIFDKTSMEPSAMPVDEEMEFFAGEEMAQADLDAPAESPDASRGFGRKPQEADQAEMAGQRLKLPNPDPRARDSKRGEGPGSSKLNIQSWATKGLRSLNIQISETTEATVFQQLDGSRLDAKLVNTSRVTWLAAGVAVLLMAMTVLMTHGSIRMKFLWVTGLLVGAQVLSLFTASMPIFDPVIELMLLAMILSAIYFVLIGSVLRIGSRLIGYLKGRFPMAAAAAIMICFVGPMTTSAQQPSDPFSKNGVKVINGADQLEELLIKLRPKTPVAIPDDVIIVPFRLDDPDGQKNADKVLIAYQEYLRLKQIGSEEKPKPRGPADYLIASTNYQIELVNGQDELIDATIAVDVLTDDPVAIPLNLSGGAFASATVDGEPARLQFVDVNQRKKSSTTATAILHLEGRGKKEFRFKFRIKAKQQGGWRLIQCMLPVGPSRGVALETTDEPIEVRINSVDDNRTIESTEAQTIRTVLRDNGALNVQWKPSAASQVVDQALTVNSDAVFDVREDGLRLNWLLAFEFRGGERTGFNVTLPEGFLVEQVFGENVRSWNVKQGGGDESDELEVTLLGPAKDRESFTVELSQREFAINETTKTFRAPMLSVPAAALHKGTVSIRKSSIVELKAGETRSANRIDSDAVARKIELSRVDRNKSPLGIESFQDFEFRATPFVIDLEAKIADETFEADTVALLRIGQSKFDVEAMVRLDIKNRPLYQLQLKLPKDFSIDSITASANETWNDQIDGEFKVVTILFPNGVTGKRPVVVKGALDSFKNVPEDFSQTLEWELPSILAVGAQRQAINYAVQTDPAINVVARELNGLETTSIRQFDNWLVASQRPMTRIAIRSLRTGMPEDRTGKLRLNRIRPRIDVESVTNIRTTLLAVEETTLLDFQIQNAGVRVLQFELPKEYRDARINARLVSETIFEDVDDQERVLVTLKLQDDVIGDYRVVVEFDRNLPDGIQNVVLPSVRTGTFKSQFITLQNAGRDEIEIEKLDGVQRLNRQLRDFTRLKNKLAGAELTLAFVADKDNQQPTLGFRLNTRETLNTVAASIGFSKTVMVVDHDGSYRAQQVFQVNNRSEQYLDVQMPDGSSLLSVVVDQTPVKPVRWTQSNLQNRIRIPLLKTAAGDLDYPVVVKYGGKLDALQTFRETKFPVIETVNINVQLSQLHLRLPESHRWLNFAGTMTKVDEAGELEEDFLSYQSRQIEKLAEQLKSGKDKALDFYSKQRAYQNLDKLSSELESYSESQQGKYSSKKSSIDALIQGNNEQIQNYRVELEKDLKDQVGVIVDNRAQLNALVVRQDAKIARNQINREGDYFVQQPQLGQVAQNYTVEVPQQQKGGQNFDQQWFKANKFAEGKKDKSEKAPPGGKVARLQELAQQGMQGEGRADANGPAPISGRQGQSRQSGESVQLSFRNSGSQTIVGGIDLQQSGARETNMNGGAGGGGFGGMNQQGSFGDLYNQQRVPNKLRDFSGGAAVTRMTNSAGEIQLGGVLLSGNQSGQLGGLDGRAQRVGLASLDIELPERGVDFYFRSPRGNVEVTAVPVKQDEFMSWISIGLVIGIVLVVWLFGSAFMGAKTVGAKAGFGFVLTSIGLVSICSGILPIFGMIALVAAVGVMVGKSDSN